MSFYREFVADAPDELGTVIRLGTIPPLPVISHELHFRPAISVGCCYAGPVEDGERTVRALRQLGTPLVDLVRPTLYVDHQSGVDDTVPHGWHYDWKATNLTGLSDDVIDVIAQHAYRARSPRSYAAMFHMGGAVARVPHDATAYPARDVAHNIIIDAAWLPDQDDTVGTAETGWARGFLPALQPHRAGVYVNFLDSDDDTSRVREAYGDHTYLRLAEIKAKYDPENVFHNNKNIKPSENRHMTTRRCPRGAGRGQATLTSTTPGRHVTRPHRLGDTARSPIRGWTLYGPPLGIQGNHCLSSTAGCRRSRRTSDSRQSRMFSPGRPAWCLGRMSGPRSTEGGGLGNRHRPRPGWER